MCRVSTDRMRQGPSLETRVPVALTDQVTVHKFRAQAPVSGELGFNPSLVTLGELLTHEPQSAYE